MKPQPKPKVEDILEMAGYLEEKYQQRNDRIIETRKRRMMANAPSIPKAYRKTAAEFRSPMIFDMLRRCVAIMATNMPSPKVVPVKLGPKAQENSSLRENWLAHAYKKMGPRVFMQLIDSLAETGAGVCKVLLQNQSWSAGPRDEDESPDDYTTRVEEHHRKHFPFIWSQVPADTYYPSPDGDEVYEVTYREDVPSLARKYGLRPQDGKLVKGRLGNIVPDDWPNRVKFIEHWTPEWFTYIVDKTIVRQEHHGYGCVPYFAAYATAMSSQSPADEGISYATPLIPLQDALDSFITIQMNWAYLNGFPTPALSPTSEDAIAVNTDKGVDWQIGELFVTPPGYRIDWMSLPSVGGDLTQLRDFFKALADQVSLAPILFGVLSGDISNATASTMIAVAKSLFGPGIADIGLMFDQIAGFIQRTIDTKLREPVPIWMTTGEKSEWLQLGPADIDGYYEVEHQIQPVIPVEQQRKAAFLADGQARGAVSMRYLREEGYMLNDPEQMADEVWVEAAEKDPRFLNVVMAEALRLYQQDANVSQGTAPVPAVPAGPGGPNTIAMNPAGPQAALVPGGAMTPPTTPAGNPIGTS